jgi:methyl-accepting chemotaxis protein WspA
MFISFMRLSISQKLRLCSLSFAVPAALMLYLMIVGINQDIEFARREQDGNLLLQPLNQLLELLPRYHLLRQSNPADNSNNAVQIKALADEIEAGFNRLQQAISRNGWFLTASGLNLPDGTVWKARWQAQQNQPAPADQQALLAELRLWARQIGNSSNLILDPDLDSYYLMDLVLLTLPQAQQRLALLLEAALAQAPAAELAARLRLEGARLEDYRANLIQAVDTALREDAAFYGASASLQANLPRLLAAYNQTLSAFLASTQGAAAGLELLQASVPLWQAGRRLSRQAEIELAQLLAIRIARYQQTRLNYLALSLGALLLAGVLLYLLTRRLDQRLQVAMDAAKSIAEGDLSVDIRDASNDDLGQLLRAVQHMAQNLNRLIHHQQQAGARVSSSAIELAASTRQQEAIMKQQAEETGAVLQRIDEIATVTNALVDTVQSVSALSEQTADMAHSSREDLSRMEEAIQRMGSAAQAISAKLQIVRDKAANITSVVVTITKVADQTNLLSLNAAIEAEQAGESGRGFTVVAQEIRRLADQTAVATLDIEDMVMAMQTAVAEGADEMRQFTQKMQQNVSDVGSISAKLSGIIDRVQGLSPSFNDVAEGVVFQNQQAMQIKEAIHRLNEDAMQIAQTLQESYQTLDQLDETVRHLNAEMQRFKLS